MFDRHYGTLFFVSVLFRLSGNIFKALQIFVEKDIWEIALFIFLLFTSTIFHQKIQVNQAPANGAVLLPSTA
jgi:hypothetical protein